MHLSRSLPLALALLLAGCGDAADDIAQPAPDDATLVVESTLSPGSQGQLLSEGALIEVELTGPDGTTVTERGPVEEELVFDGLAAGSYVVRPALRPCIANCGNLADRTDECEQTIEVPATTRVRVDSAVGEPCTVVTVE